MLKYFIIEMVTIHFIGPISDVGMEASAQC